MRHSLCALALVAAGGTFPAHADEPLWLTYTARSYHANRDAGYREHNPGFGLEYQASRTWAIVFGGYRNSFSQPTRYLGSAWTPLLRGGFKAGVFGALATGYADTPRAVVMPTLVYEHGYFGANVIISHKVVGVQFKVSLW